MTSKNSSSKSKLGFVFKHSLSRISWIILIWCLILFIISVLIPLMRWTTIQSNDYETSRYVMNDTFNFFYMAAAVFMCIISMIAGSGFNYLNKKESVDFYHSQPFSRKQWFWGKYLAGLAGIYVPLLVASAVFTGISRYFSHVFSFKYVLLNTALEVLNLFIILFVFYNIFVFCKILSGKNILGYCLSAIFIVLPGATSTFLKSFSQELVYKIYDKSINFRNSPINPYNLINITKKSDIAKSISINEKSTIIFISIWVLIATALLVGAYYMHKTRKNEGNNIPIANPLLAYPIKAVLIIAGTSFSLWISLGFKFAFYSSLSIFALIASPMTFIISIGVIYVFIELLFPSGKNFINKKSILFMAGCILLTVSIIILMVVYGKDYANLTIPVLNGGMIYE
ncbi:hypothetical protein LJB90_04010 [Eubacteriales bacterium OttesenSCG-928-G02]|nr:hypothetical protein [Eubacteriales bacterium OttesenSCG-928-G02]